jgi:hypothetical protein
MTAPKPLRHLSDPVRPLQDAVFDCIVDDLARFPVERVKREDLSPHYRGASFEVRGTKFLLLLVPEDSALAVWHRQDACHCVDKGGR